MDYNLCDLLVFGMDGTIRRPVGSDKQGKPLPTPNESDQWILLPRVRSVFADLREAIRDRKYGGHTPLRIGFMSNQGGIEYGIINEKKARNLIKEAVLEAFDGDFPPFMIRVCTVTEDADPMRLPNPGMIHEFMREARVAPIRTMVVGLDKEEEAARVSKTQFIHADKFFDR